MSRLITHTNIMVDDFDFAKSFPKDTFQHFLTHFHADHYQGLTPLWNYGDIHCTHQTKVFLMDKYPKLPRVFAYDYDKTYTLTLVEDILDIQFTFFDAKHIPGAAMILFKGYMGTILFTGDFRYEYDMVKSSPLLFPPRFRNFQEKREIVEQMPGISIKVDQMIFDNTYCNKAFNFGREPQITEKMINIIDNNRHKKLIYIALGALGKQQILMKLAKYFQTLIVVSDSQFNKIKLAQLRTDFLTTNESEGFIHLISKRNRAEIVDKTKKGPLGEHFICIDTDFLMLSHQAPDGINYIVPYSLHSNYKQMEALVRMVQPSILRKIVIPYANFKQVKLRMKIDHRMKFAKYLQFLENQLHKSDSGYSYLVKEYTFIYELSVQYLDWMHPKKHAKLLSIFGLGTGEQNHDLRKRKPVLLSEEQMSQKYKKKGKESLKNIADKLNATNKNETLEKAFENHEERKNSKKYDNIFDNESWEYSNSRTINRSPESKRSQSTSSKIVRYDHCDDETQPCV